MLKIFYSFYNILYIIIYYTTIPFVLILVKLRILPCDFLEYYGFISHKRVYNQSIWFHCASVGEIKSIIELIRIIKKELPQLNIIITTMTISGKKTAKKEINDTINFLLPVENTRAIRRIIKKYNIKLLFIVETELWPNLINSASKYCRLFLINGRLSQKSYKKYKILNFIFKDLLHKFNRIYAKSEYDKTFLENIALKHIDCTGNIKFTNNPVILNEKIIKLFNNKKCLLLASTHNGEESFFIQHAYRYMDMFDNIIIAPRHIKRIDKIQQILKKYKYSYTVFSLAKKFEKFILVDQFGLMDSFYAISYKIFIGGSMVNIGGHNIYEALRLKKIISVGPYMNNFKEIYELALFYHLIYQINNIEDFLNYLYINVEKNELFNDFLRELEYKNKEILKHITGIIKNEIVKC